MELGLPPRNVAQIKRLAMDVTKRHRRKLFVGCGVLFLVGYCHGSLTTSVTALPRYGALVTLLTLWHAFVQFRYITMFELAAEPIAMELAKEIGKEDRAPQLLAGLRAGIQRRFTLDHLAAASAGTFVWGFGDLLPLVRI
ncbi:hypothetical protein [Ensifer sp. Root558]|uniref:hypothetical protein n=1 Tax=Ensifer sp. Root558 TaxID=1736558 RepID=UPI000712FF37|nr:hypothetical protein [Ensifer sp. Root558]KQZ41843.1 hypothetical protein ASD63_16735 [Ensifer sp. Root558]